MPILGILAWRLHRRYSKLLRASWKLSLKRASAEEGFQLTIDTGSFAILIKEGLYKPGPATQQTNVSEFIQFNGASEDGIAPASVRRFEYEACEAVALTDLCRRPYSTSVTTLSSPTSPLTTSWLATSLLVTIYLEMGKSIYFLTIQHGH